MKRKEAFLSGSQTIASLVSQHAHKHCLYEQNSVSKIALDKKTSGQVFVDLPRNSMWQQQPSKASALCRQDVTKGFGVLCRAVTHQGFGWDLSGGRTEQSLQDDPSGHRGPLPQPCLTNASPSATPHRKTCMNFTLTSSCIC